MEDDRLMNKAENNTPVGRRTRVKPPKRWREKHLQNS